MTTAPGSRPSSWPLLLAVACALALLLSLGTWQLQRKQWKEQLLADIAARSNATTPLDDLPPALERWDYALVRLSGSFVPGTIRHVFISVPRQPNGVGGPGYWVFQQFAHRGGHVYVNRGFIPEREKARDLVAPAEVVIQGLFRLPEPRGRFTNANSPDKNVYFLRSPMEFLGPTKDPITNIRTDSYVDMTAQLIPPPTDALPLPLVGRLAIANRHLEYAMTWYALAATLLGVTIAFLRRRRTDHVSS